MITVINIILFLVCLLCGFVYLVSYNPTQEPRHARDQKRSLIFLIILVLIAILLNTIACIV